MNCLFLSGDFKFQISPKVLISCPLIANLSDGLKIMDSGFITCDDIGKLLFVIFWKHLKQLFGHFNPLPLLLLLFLYIYISGWLYVVTQACMAIFLLSGTSLFQYMYIKVGCICKYFCKATCLATYTTLFIFMYVSGRLYDVTYEGCSK